MPTRARIALDTAQVADFCRRHRITKLSLFGSVLRDDFDDDSDVDVLVEFTPGVSVTLLKLVAMEMELTELVGRKVDLRMPADLSRHFRQQVIDEAEALYVHR